MSGVVKRELRWLWRVMGDLNVTREEWEAEQKSAE